MFSSGANYSKLKTNLRLCINRLKLLEKKKTELALKSRKEIADYLALGKIERAKIRVEHIIREDYLVEAMEILEMFCDLVLARFGLIQQMKTLDDGLAESISSLIWVAPRLQSDVAELKIVSDQLSAKYGKPYAMACRENAVGTVSEKLMHKLSVQAPPKLTVEKYLIEIAKYYNVEYQPDPAALAGDETYAADALIDLAPAPPLPDKKDFDDCRPQQQQPYVPFNYPSGAPQYPPGAPQYPGGAAGGAPPYPSDGGAMGFTIPPNVPTQVEKKKADFDNEGPPPAYFPPDMGNGGSESNRQNSIEDNTQKPASSSNLNKLDFPDLPGVPTDFPSDRVSSDEDEKKENNDEEIDFDDLTRRFEALKKKK